MYARTIVVLAVRPKEEGSTLEGRTSRTELGNLRDIGRERRGVPVGLRRLGGIVVPAHSGRCTAMRSTTTTQPRLAVGAYSSGCGERDKRQSFLALS